MADNVAFQSGTLATPAAGTSVATDKVTYSGDPNQDVQLVRVVNVSGAEGAKTVDSISGTGGVLVDLGANNDVTVTGTVSVTEPVSVDDNSASLTVDAPVGTPVNVQIGDGTETAVVLNTGTNDSLAVAVVDASGNQITSFGGGTQYTEDDPAAANPTGTMPVLVRDDTPNTQTTTDGDVIAQRGTNYGAAYVQVVTSAGAFVDAFGGSGGTAQADESAFTEGTTSMTPVGGVLNDTITSDPTEDQAAAFRITPKRGIHANLRKNDGTEIASGGGVEANALRVTIASDSTGVLSIDDGGNIITVDGTVGISGAVDTELPAIQTHADNLAISNAPAVIGANYVYDGTNWDRQRGDQTDGTLVNLGTNNDVTVAGVATAANQLPDGHNVTIDNASGASAVNIQDGGNSLTVDGTVAVSGTVTVDMTTNNDVQGTGAHDAAASGNPFTTAGTHETPADSAPATRLATVTDGDVQRFATVDGAQYVIPGGPQQWKARLTGAMSDTTVKAAPGAGLSLYITTIVYSIGAATASSILLEESTTTAVFGPHYLEAVNGRGFAITLGTPIKIAANTLLSATSTGATTNTLDVYGFTAPG